MDFTKLREINALQADRELDSTRHAEGLAHVDNVSQTVLSATSSLIQYIEGHTSKVEVINQLEAISTPDVKYVVEALQVLDATIKSQPETDLSGVTAMLSELVEQTRQIPKELPEAPELPTPVDYSDQFKDLREAIDSAVTAIKAQELHVEAPKVDVAAPNVHVDAPDMKPISKGLDSVEKAQKLTTDELKEIAAKTQTGLITEPFDEYKVVWSVPFDDEEPYVKAIKYLNNGKVVTTLSYKYDKEGNLTGAKRS